MSDTQIIDISDLNELRSFAESLSTKILPPIVITLKGELGTGKTTFTTFLLKALGIQKDVTSPTFSILHKYKTESDKVISHLDLYRLKTVKELEQIGFQEILEDSDLTIIEWPELIEDSLPKNSLKLQFNLDKNDTRTVTLTPVIV